MNNSSPFVPQSSVPEQKNASRKRVRLAVFCILSIHVAGLMALLLTNGCRRQEPEPIPAPEQTNMFSDPTGLEMPTNTVEPVETNVSPVVPEPETNLAPVNPTPAPTPTPAPDFAAPAAGQEYTIVKGDTFAGIASKFPGVTSKAIQDANPGVQPTKLRIGQKIQIPPPSISTPAPGATPLPDSGASQVYTVKAGDNLIKIATRFSTTVRALRAENNLTTDKIRVGQKLKIPAKQAPAPVAPTETGTSAPILTPPAQ